MKSCFLLLALAAACHYGKPTGATCPTSSTLTYASFGQSFLTTYCAGCHSSAASDRHGAPGSVNFDSLAQVQSRRGDIDRLAGAGPKASNALMPDPNAPHVLAHFTMPSSLQRQQLSEWLACGAPD